MKDSLRTCAVFGLCVSAVAQGTVFSPHPSFRTADGGSYSQEFGRFKGQRMQLIDGNFQSAAMTIKEQAFRMGRYRN